MAKQYASIRNLQFLLHEVFQATDLNRLEYFRDYDEQAFEFVLDAARQLGDQYLYPIYRKMDREKAYFKDGEVHTLPELNEAIRAIGEGGWINAHLPAELGGQQMPMTLLNAGIFILNCANANAAPYAFLTQGAANLIATFGREGLKDSYLPAMFNGTWQGTMALTEPQAGSSLSDLTTVATPTEDGHYLLSGQKIYISGGDYGGVENIVHLTLARIAGAPAGTRGVSLFVVPKYRPENGELVFNNVTTAGIYGKMGQKGYTAAHLMLGEQGPCHGYLVGEPHRGLAQMFQMMNEARIATGNLSAGTATAAYYASLQYARERAQGRHPGEKDPNQPPVLIIEHADVRRMLLFQKCVTEGSLALVLQASYWTDLATHGTEEERADAHLLLELITPVVKSYPSEMGNHSVSTGMQVLGGAGYTDDFPLEQYFRDIRVNTIYEGTTTIHGLDLLGRKITMEKGKAVKLLMQEIQGEIAAASKRESLREHATQLGSAAQTLHKTILRLMQVAAEKDPKYFLADATLFLEAFGLVTVGWLWLKQARIAESAHETGAQGKEEQDFYRGKILVADYFFAYELPKIQPLLQRLAEADGLTVDLDSDWIV